MNICEHERNEAEVWQAHELAAVKILGWALAALIVGGVLLLCGCSKQSPKHHMGGTNQPPPSSIIPPAAAPRMASAAVVTSNGCQVISGTNRRGKTFTVTNCPSLVLSNVLISFDTELVPQSQWKQQYLMASTDLRTWQRKVKLTNGLPIKLPKTTGEFYAIGQ